MVMESVVTIALSVRADGLGSKGGADGGGEGSRSKKAGGASAALKLVDGQLDVAEQRLGKIELRAGQLQLIGGPRLEASDSDDSDAEEGAAGSAAAGDSAADPQAAEQAALATLFTSPTAGMELSAGWSERLVALGEMVAEMRAVESSVEFHTALLSAVRSQAILLACC
jgi:hypothetical protein